MCVPAVGSRFWGQIEDLKSELLIKSSPGFSAGLTQPWGDERPLMDVSELKEDD